MWVDFLVGYWMGGMDWLSVIGWEGLLDRLLVDSEVLGEGGQVDVHELKVE